MTQAATEARRSLSRQAVEELSARFDEPDWLLKRRLEAWRLFEEAPMPDPLSEEWKRTDASLLTLDGLLPFGQPRAVIEAADGLPSELRSLWDAEDELAGRLIQHDSDVVHTSLDEELARQGVILTDLHAAAREHADLVREHLFSAVSPAEWKYLSLHGALWSGGGFVHVPEGVEVALPIAYAIGLTTPQIGCFPHLLIVAEPNSKVTVIQDATSPALEGLSVVPGAVEIIARDGAQVRFIDMQRWGDYWRFTSRSARRLFEELWSHQDVQVQAYGNVVAGIASLHGLAAQELSQEELDYCHPDYELIITVRAFHPEARP